MATLADDTPEESEEILINVASPETVGIDKPSDGASFDLGRTVTVEVAAPGVQEVRLELTPGPSPAPDNVAPWSFNWTPSKAGTYKTERCQSTPVGAALTIVRAFEGGTNSRFTWTPWVPGEYERQVHRVA